MMIENLFELFVILMALFYSKFARLPLMVACNIFIFASLKMTIESAWHIEISPGYEIYYAGGSVYFLVMAALFFWIPNRFYALVGVVLTIQALASAMMLINDSFYVWHEFINDKMLLVECVLVWLSSVRSSNENRCS